jgi:hypothetical protein
MRRDASSGREVPCGLARSRIEVLELLKYRIKAGYEIRDRPVRNADDLATYATDSNTWMEYNYNLLQTLFTNDLIAQEYRAAIPQFLITRNARLNFRNSKTKIIHQLMKLESICERLEFYPEPEGIAPQRARSDSRRMTQEVRFSRRAVIAATEVMEQKLATHASLTRELLKLDPRLAARCDSGSLTDRFNHLIKFFDEDPGYRLDDGELLWDKFVETAVSFLRPPIEPISWELEDQVDEPLATPDEALRRALELDGFVVSGKRLRRALPVDAGLPAAQNEVDRLLVKHSFAVPKGHLDQAMDAHVRGNWAGANGQFRPFFEGLLDVIAEKLVPSEGDSLRRLLQVGFIQRDLNERDFVQGLMKRLHPKGPHPGLSGEEDSTFRFHVVLLTARLLRTRFDTWKKT